MYLVLKDRIENYALKRSKVIFIEQRELTYLYVEVELKLIELFLKALSIGVVAISSPTGGFG